MGGTLYIVATPIGNLEDMSHRAIKVLAEVDAIAAEDTRHTRKLLNHFQITQKLVSYHEHNETVMTPKLVVWLQEGRNLALVSDAGTPLISDPGYRLVQEAVLAGITVVPIPGPSAAIAALQASGFPTDRFYFMGFLPLKGSKRRRLLASLRELPATLICYEGPHRLAKTLGALYESLGERPCVLARELTKVHEEFRRGLLSELMQELKSTPLRGEVVILLAPPA